MDLELWIAFATLQFMFAITPGPAVVLVAAQSASRGWKAGFEGALGVQAGNGIYFVISALGLGVVLATSEMLFTAVKWAGALYLVYMGVKTILNARKAELPEAEQSLSLWRRPFTQSFVGQLANPKSILFFAALFPQFIDQSSETAAMQFLVMGATMVAIELPVLCVYAWLAVQGQRIGGARGAVWRERICGGSLIAIGGVLATVRKA